MKPTRLETVLTAGVAVIALSLLPVPAVAQSAEETAEGGGHSGHEMQEGAITFSGQGQEHSTKVLGGVIGKEVVEQVDVGLFVLQAESPDRLKEGGQGPTHIFNVTLTDLEVNELIRQATGAVTVTGSDGRQQREELRPFASHFQVRVRLNHPGEYLVRVDFEAAGRSGATGSMPFTYRRKDPDAAGEAEEHPGHVDHSEHGDHDG